MDYKYKNKKVTVQLTFTQQHEIKTWLRILFAKFLRFFFFNGG